MAQRQANFPLSRRQKRRPRRTKPASMHLLVAAAFAISTILYAVNYLYHSRTTHVANLDDTIQNDRKRNGEEHQIEDDRDVPETGETERDSPTLLYL